MIEGPSISENNAVLSEECAENLENEERPAKRFKMTEKEDKDLGLFVLSIFRALCRSIG